MHLLQRQVPPPPRRNDLVAAVEHILDNTPVRSVVVETNGLADPAQSIKQFWFDEQMNIRAVLHSVVAVVSARRWPALRNDPLLEKQLVFANKVLLTFLDVAAENRQQMEQQVRGVNAECELAGGEVDLGAFLEGKSLFSTDWERQLVGSQPTHHPGGVRPVFLRGRATAGSKGELERMVGELLWQSGLEILRIKGVVCLQDSPTVLELQGVEDIFEVKETATPVSVYQGESRILAVGKGLEKGQLLAALGIIEPQ